MTQTEFYEWALQQIAQGNVNPYEGASAFAERAIVAGQHETTAREFTL